MTTCLSNGNRPAWGNHINTHRRGRNQLRDQLSVLSDNSRLLLRLDKRGFSRIALSPKDSHLNPLQSRVDKVPLGLSSITVPDKKHKRCLNPRQSTDAQTRNTRDTQQSELHYGTTSPLIRPDFSFTFSLIPSVPRSACLHFFYFSLFLISVLLIICLT